MTESSSNQNYWVNIGLTVLALVILFFLIGSYYNHRNKGNRESFDNHSHTTKTDDNNHQQFVPGPLDNIQTNNIEKETEKEINIVSAQKGKGKNEVFAPVPNLEKNTNGDPFGLKGNQFPNDTYPKDKLTASELLPSDPNSKWAQVNPAGQGELGDQNFLEAGFHMGTNTVGQTMRNPNLQLRSEPPCPQVKVSPWMQTTIEPDINRKPLEIGGH